MSPAKQESSIPIGRLLNSFLRGKETLCRRSARSVDRRSGSGKARGANATFIVRSETDLTLFPPLAVSRYVTERQMLKESLANIGRQNVFGRQ